jgi:putative MATE family efflux protein
VKKITSFCFWTALVIGALMAVLIMASMRPLLTILGTSESTFIYCKQYMTWVGLGAPFVILHFTTSNLIRSEGGAKETMTGTMIGTITNMILDPIMIFWMGMGVVGAAAATIIGYIFSNIYFLWYILKKSKTLSLAAKHYSASWKLIVAPLLVVGVPASLNNLMGSIASVLLNNEMVRFGENALAGYGVAGKVNSMAVMVLIAIAFGVQPLLGYCYGAANKERFMAALKYTIKMQVLIGTVGMVVIEILAAPLVRFFIDEAQVVQYG